MRASDRSPTLHENTRGIPNPFFPSTHLARKRNCPTRDRLIG